MCDVCVCVCVCVCVRGCVFVCVFHQASGPFYGASAVDSNQAPLSMSEHTNPCVCVCVCVCVCETMFVYGLHVW